MICINGLQHLCEATGKFLGLGISSLVEKSSQGTAPCHATENLQCLFSFPFGLRALSLQGGLPVVFSE